MGDITIVVKAGQVNAEGVTFVPDEALGAAAKAAKTITSNASFLAAAYPKAQFIITWSAQ